MPHRIAIAVAGQSGSAGFPKAPVRREARLCAAHKQQRVTLGRGPELRECSFVETEQHYLGRPGIGDGAAEEIGRRAGQCEQREIKPPGEDSAIAMDS